MGFLSTLQSPAKTAVGGAKSGGFLGGIQKAPAGYVAPPAPVDAPKPSPYATISGIIKSAQSLNNSSEQLQSGIAQGTQGLKEAVSPTSNLSQRGEGALNFGAGLIGAAFSPFAAVTSTLGKAINGAGSALANTSYMQGYGKDIANSPVPFDPQTDTATRILNAVQNASVIGQAALAPFLPKPKLPVSSTATESTSLISHENVPVEHPQTAEAPATAQATHPPVASAPETAKVSSSPHATTLAEIPQEQFPIKSEISKLEDMKNELAIRQNVLANNPAKSLSKYANQNGELPEVLGGKGKLGVNPNGSTSKFGTHGDDIVTELGYNDSEHARSSYQDYLGQKKSVAALKNAIKEQTMKAKDEAFMNDLHEKTVEKLAEEHGGWPTGMKVKFDEALMHKDAATVSRLLPKVPKAYKVEFASEIESITQPLAAEALKPTRSSTQTLKPIEGTGELRTRGLSQNVEASAIEKKLSDNFGDLPEYRQVSMKDQAMQAADLLERDPETARAIALGEKAPPKGLLPESVYVAAEHKATLAGDVATLRDLANSKLAGSATTMGQRIRTLGERDSHSPVAAIQEVQRARAAAQATRNESLPRTVERIRSSIRKTNTKESWSEFVNSISC